MKKLILIYLAGAIVTKLVVWNTAIDSTRTVLEWPLLWLKSPQGMTQLASAQLDASGSGIAPAVSQVATDFPVAPSTYLAWNSCGCGGSGAAPNVLPLY